MKEVTLYTTATCPYCMRALRLLDKKGVAYTNVLVTKEKEAFEKIKQQTGWDTVPQIFIDGAFIGGCDDMLQLEREKKLDVMLGR